MLRIGGVIVLGRAEYTELVDAGRFVEEARAGERLIWRDLLRAAATAEAYLPRA